MKPKTVAGGASATVFPVTILSYAIEYKALLFSVSSAGVASTEHWTPGEKHLPAFSYLVYSSTSYVGGRFEALSSSLFCLDVSFSNGIKPPNVDFKKSMGTPLYRPGPQRAAFPGRVSALLTLISN